MSHIPGKKPFSLTIDLLADWRPWAAALPPPRTDKDWRLFGTVTFNGTTGALAWKAREYGIVIGNDPVRRLGVRARRRISEIMEFESPPGRELAPRFNPHEPWGSRYLAGLSVSLARWCGSTRLRRSVTAPRLRQPVRIR
ncbi:MAG: hypothetical protein EPN49_01560 [Rhodanobacter sp.]|nr:MAG: hypothetical protein EPN49_01560 [Rhodanobacter sp.]